MFYENCKEILLKEIELIMKASILQQEVSSAVLDREWEGFDENISELNSIEKEIILFEEKRESLFNQYSNNIKINENIDDQKHRFYQITCMLPEEQRNELTDIYRSLKVETLKLRIANETYVSYLTGVKNTIKDFFDSAFPERKTYTQAGTHFSNDMRSMVLNQAF